MNDMYDDTMAGAIDPAMVPAPIEQVSVPKEQIYVYVKSIEPSSFSEESDICPFDISLTVESRGSNPDGTMCSKSYNIVKRIAFDKVKLLQGAVLNTTPVTMVEGQKPDPIIALKEQMKRLAGV